MRFQLLDNTNDSDNININHSKSAKYVYLLDSLDMESPVNLGWPIYEGSLRVKNKQIDSENILKPIFETKIRPGCVTGGVYLNEIDALFLQLNKKCPLVAHFTKFVV